MREITEIAIHCSASPWGDAAIIEKWHLARGFLAIGYHKVVLNGYRTARSDFDPELVGYVEDGRDLDGDGDVEEEVGAHVFGMNRTIIGVCFIGPRRGDEKFSERQLRCGARLVAELCARYNLGADKVKGHNEYPSGAHKECPVLDMDDFRGRVSAYLNRQMSLPLD